MPDKRRVVYLFGTGASQAEISRKNPDVRILMGDIAEGIQKRIDKDNIELLEEVKNELAGKNVDVEHLITLYASSGTSNHIQIANELRRLFREEIQNRIGMLGSTFSPRLITALIDMYNIPELDEDLVGILTLNYDDLTDRACQMVYGGVNYLIEIESGDSRLDTNSKATPLIKLHGSFNWKNEFPISLVNEGTQCNEKDILWIPPGVEKNMSRYPFNILWGKARELFLNCDILRVVGCSLSRNDWALVSLLYVTQKLSTKRYPYKMEIIDFIKCYEKIESDYSYLSTWGINEIPEVTNYLINLYSLDPTKKSLIEPELTEILNNKDRTNILDMWLRANGEYLIEGGISVSTDKHFFEEYITEHH